MGITLKDQLMWSGMDAEKLAFYTGRSIRTIQRWDKYPPAYVIRIINLYSKRTSPPVKHWENWYFEDDFILDPDGNHYQQDEIRAIFFNRQLIHTLIGKPMNVVSLKKELEQRIDAYSGKLKISIGEAEGICIDLAELG